MRKIVVLGHSGFIGTRVLARLAALAPDIELVGFSAPQTDITSPAGAKAICEAIDGEAAVLMLAAIKRQLGDTPDIYLENTAILTAFANIVADNPPARVIYLSSGAVYGEDVENRAIDEETPVMPRSYYGLSKVTAEWILTKVLEGKPTTLGLLRPATIYGPGDLATSYGPSGFLDAVVHDREVVFWGDGSELRELLYIDDVVDIIARYTFSDHTGPLNVAAGRSYTFRDALDAVSLVTGRAPKLVSRSRSKPKVDNQYKNGRLTALFPNLTFTSLESGVRQTFEQRYKGQYT
jgi:UDP-glucose 4-epimerase